MKRNRLLLRDIKKSDEGLEIAPFFRPIVPKAEGYNAKILDVLNQAELVEHATQHPLMGSQVCERIEPVDFVISANDIDTLGEDIFDYIVSSHNFEHLPNPLKFLQGASKILRPGGQLTMALPDCRRSLDQFRTHTLIGDWIEAFRENRTSIPARQGFETVAYLSSDEFSLKLTGDLQDAYEQWDCADYRDIHISVFCPASFELLIREAQALGLINLTLQGVSSYRWEFHCWLSNVAPEPFDIRAERERLLFKIRKQLRQRLPLILRAANLYGLYKQKRQSNAG